MLQVGMNVVVGLHPVSSRRRKELDKAERTILNEMLAGMATAVLLCDAEGRVEVSNASGAALVGTRQNLRELCRDPDQIGKIDEALEHRLPFEVVVGVNCDGETRHVMLRGHWLEADRSGARMLVEGTDISAIRHQEKQLRARLCRDELTGAASRRYFLDVGERALLDTHRYGRPLSVLMLDLDGFKKINDDYGHAVGDQFLCFVTEVCTRMLRRNDLLGRLGGDEFAALLPGTDVSRAEAVARRLRLGLKEAIRTNPVAQSTITMSIGIAGCVPTDRSIHEAIARADEALYAAKRSGRDAIRRHDRVEAA